MYEKYINSISYNNKDKCYHVQANSDLVSVGYGKRGSVFKIKNERKVIKVFHPTKIEALEQEVKAYQILFEDNEFYSKFYACGSNYLVVDYIEGKSLFECFVEGVFVPPYVIEKVDQGITYAISKGLQPADVHYKNIIWNTETNEVKIVDLERFPLQINCKRWENFKKFYYRFYLKSYFPKKIPIHLLDHISNFYRGIEKFVKKIRGGY